MLTGVPESLHPEGCKLLETMEGKNLKYLSIGEPTYWPSDKHNYLI
jgi:hypothetical protein